MFKVSIIFEENENNEFFSEHRLLIEIKSNNINELKELREKIRSLIK